MFALAAVIGRERVFGTRLSVEPEWLKADGPVVRTVSPNIRSADSGEAG